LQGAQSSRMDIISRSKGATIHSDSQRTRFCGWLAAYAHTPHVCLPRNMDGTGGHCNCVFQVATTATPRVMLAGMPFHSAPIVLEAHGVGAHQIVCILQKGEDM
jgi:hypothetical protein